MSVLWFKTNK